MARCPTSYPCRIGTHFLSRMSAFPFCLSPSPSVLTDLEFSFALRSSLACIFHSNINSPVITQRSWVVRFKQSSAWIASLNSYHYILLVNLSHSVPPRDSHFIGVHSLSHSSPLRDFRSADVHPVQTHKFCICKAWSPLLTESPRRSRVNVQIL